MLTICYGLPAYVLTPSRETADTARPRPIEIPDDDLPRLRVVPFDNTPPFFLPREPLRITEYAGCRELEIPPSPLSYASEQKTLAVLASRGTVFRVKENARPVLESDDGQLCAPLPRGIRDVRLRAGDNRGATVLALSARHPAGQYLFVAEKRESWKILIDTPCVRAEQRNGATLILTDPSPSGLIATVTVYDSAFRAVESHPVYTGAPAAEDPVLKVYDYLALRMDDRARALLSEKLLSDTPYEDAVSFFGNYRRVLPAATAPGCYALFRDDRRADLCRAEIEDGQIVDLIDLVHPLLNISPRPRF